MMMMTTTIPSAGALRFGVVNTNAALFRGQGFTQCRLMFPDLFNGQWFMGSTLT